MTMSRKHTAAARREPGSHVAKHPRVEAAFDSFCRAFKLRRASGAR